MHHSHSIGLLMTKAWLSLGGISDSMAQQGPGMPAATASHRWPPALPSPLLAKSTDTARSRIGCSGMDSGSLCFHQDIIGLELQGIFWKVSPGFSRTDVFPIFSSPGTERAQGQLSPGQALNSLPSKDLFFKLSANLSPFLLLPYVQMI